MSNPKATVKSRPLSVYDADACVEALLAQIAAGMSCAAVQSSPLAKQALADQQAAVAILSEMLTTKANCIKALAAAMKAITTQFPKVVGTTRTYESSVDAIAGGDPAIITAAGALARGEHTPAAALGVVKDVKSKPGKAAKETVVTWPKVRGATSYAMQVNAAARTGPYTALPGGSSRRRVILAPAPGAQILVQIAAVASNGAQSAWCAPFLATAK